MRCVMITKVSDFAIVLRNSLASGLCDASLVGAASIRKETGRRGFG